MNPRNQSVASMAAKIGAAIFSVASLTLTVAGVINQEWYAGFGVVLIMTALLCLVAAHLPENNRFTFDDGKSAPKPGVPREEIARSHPEHRQATAS